IQEYCQEIILPLAGNNFIYRFHAGIAVILIMSAAMATCGDVQERAVHGQEGRFSGSDFV
ncbi:MAG: hypothetical protein ABF826_12160, partial [Komagataeibacter saccharivorans]|uniref:hypothetical protein n=1 Tax=Komagataeibacter saccharivorans TaxID=265959 RepID=UPI0039ECADD4